MKKLRYTVLTVLLLAIVMTLASCKLPTFGPGTGDTPGGDEKENMIFNSKTEIQLVFGDEVSEDKKSEIFDTLYPVFIKAPIVCDDSRAQVSHEIVIGESERSVSKEAYRRFNRLAEDYPSDTVGYLVYSDGSSVAIAYKEDKYNISLALDLAFDLLYSKIEEYELILPEGTVKTESFDAYEKQKAIDEITREEQWATLAEELGTHGEAIVAAFKDMYGMYTIDMIYWYANLYDPAIGGYYYSNSGRNTEGYLPDIESTAQALGAITTSGMVSSFASGYAKAIPDWMREQIIRFTKSLQHPGGYFYHPQWGKEFTDTKVSRRARDLGNATSVLYALGSAPTYNTPNGDKGDGILADGSKVSASSAALPSRLGGSLVTAVSKVVATSSDTEVPYFLVDEAAFRTYLSTLDIKNEAYSIGNTMTAQKQQISNRDKQIGTEDNPTPLMDILINWFNENQNPERGSWANEEQQGTYNEINGIMKITGVYGGAEVLMPNADKAIWIILDAIGYEETPGAVVDVYNTWYAASRVLRHMRDYGDESDQLLADEVVDQLRAKAPDLIRDSAKKLSVFRKVDGSFSYTPNASSANSQGCPVAIRGTNEGDVNATVICSSDILVYIYSALNVSDRVPIYTYADWLEYKYTLENLNPVIKNPEVVMTEPYSFDEDDEGTFEHDTITTSLKSASSYANIVKDTDRSGEGNYLEFSTAAGKESILISSGGLASSKTCYVFEADMCIYEASANYPIQMYISGCYMISIRVQNGKLTLIESTSSSAKKSKDTPLGLTPEFGEWFKIRMEYYAGSVDTTRIKVFYNNELVAVTDGFYDEEGDRYSSGNVTPGRISNNVQIYVLNGVHVKMGLDNIMFYKNDDKYVAVTDPELSPEINVDLVPSLGDIELSGGEYYNGDAEGIRYDFTEKTTKEQVYNKTYTAPTETAEGFSTVGIPMNGTAKGGVYRINNSSNWKGIAFAHDASIIGETGDFYIFETDFVWLGGSQTDAQRGSGAAFVGFLGEHNSVDNGQMRTSGLITFDGQDSNKIKVLGAVLDKGVSYNLRFVYQVGGTIRLYVDGELAPGSKLYNKDVDDTTYQGFGIYFRKDFVEALSIVLDNMYLGIERGDGTILPTVPSAPPAVEPETAVNPDSYFNNQSLSGTRYTFEDGDTYTAYDPDTNPNGFLTKPLEGDSKTSYEEGKIYVDINKVLGITVDGAFAGVSLAYKGEAVQNATKYVFETDFIWLGGTPGSQNTVAFLGFTTGNETNPDMISYGNVSILDNEGSAVSFWGSSFEKGVWYNIRFEYEIASATTYMYVNGVPMGAVTASVGANASTNSLDFKGFGIYVRNRMNEPVSFALNNVYISVE